MTLVIGGTGKTGRRIVTRLRERGLPVRSASRSSEPPFDWEDQATWGPALRGASSAYVSFFPDLAVPGAPEAIAALAGEALSAGVKRLVLLSGRGEEEAQRAEQALQASGADWTIVRCSWFAQNFSEDYLLEAVLAGEIALPVTDMPEPFVDADDIADVAVAALIEDGHSGQVYELTGPRLLTFAEAVQEIGRATGRDLRFIPVAIRITRRSSPRTACPRTSPACCATCSPSSSTAATRRSPTASSGRSAVSRGTSPTTRATRRRRGSGMPNRRPGPRP